jgi:hypothetical protein
VVGVQVGDPDAVQLIEPDVALQLSQRTGAGIHPQPRTPARHQVARTGILHARVRRGTPQNREPERGAGHPWSLERFQITLFCVTAVAMGSCSAGAQIGGYARDQRNQGL